MSVVLILALLGTTAPGAKAKPLAKPPAAQRCAGPSAERVDLGPPKAKLRKLGELPPAKPFYTVVREIDGCPQNVVVPAYR